MRKLYWAYGSNLNISQMKRRCPRAKKVGPFHVRDGTLVFRGVADVERKPGGIIPGGLWEITDWCEDALDDYEGVKSGIYRRMHFLITRGGVKRDVLFYQMRRRKGIMPPSEPYLDVIAEGYRDFGLDLAYLDEALRNSWDDKRVTEFLRERHTKRGRPRLARVEG